MVKVIELFGCPGAGKTTLARALVRDPGMLNQTDLSTNWRRTPAAQRLWHIQRSLTDRSSTLAAARFAVASGLTNGDSLRRLSRLVARTAWIRSQSRPLLLDQGYLQEIWSILYSARRLEPNMKQLSMLLGSIYRGLSAKIIFIDVHPDLAADRVARRLDGFSRLDRMSRAQVHESLSGTFRLSRRIVWAAHGSGLDIEVIDGTVPVADLASRLQPALNRLGEG